MRILDVVDVLVRLKAVEGSHASTFCAQMRMIIGSVEQIGDTRLRANDAEKSAHKCCYCLNDKLIYCLLILFPVSFFKVQKYIFNSFQVEKVFNMAVYIAFSCDSPLCY